MGTDLFDIELRIERTFQIKLSDDGLQNLERDYDIVVGDLYAAILEKLHFRDVGRHSLRLNAFLWSQMQAARHTATDLPPEQLKLSLPLEDLFPRKTRRAGWAALQAASAYNIRELDYSRRVRLAGFAVALAVVVIEHLQLWQMIPGAIFLWPVLGLLGIWMVIETYLKILSIAAPLRTCFPSSMRTVKDLCRMVLATNYSNICKDCSLAPHEPCSRVWEQLVAVLAEVLAVDPGMVTSRSRLVGDLGAA